MIWINRNTPNDRKRFNLAHELGHLVMHLRSEDLEKSEDQKEIEANQFAGEFLMPASQCKEDLFNLKYKDLGMKKYYWKVSKAAIIYRAKELNCIPEETARYLYVTLGRNGERKKETVQVPIDAPKIVKKMYDLHVTESQHLYSGLVQYGGELMMTLSPSIALSIYDRHYFKDKEELDGCFIEASDKEIRRYNMMQYFYATRHVFSFKNDFRLIEFIYNMRGGSHEFMTPHLKAEVVSGLGRY